MSWLSSFWSHNRNFIGNALKNVAPAAFLIPGVGPLAAAGIGGLGSALGRGIQKGANIGDILKQGASGAAMAYTGSKLTGGEGKSLQKLKGLFSGGGGGGNAAGNVAKAAPKSFSMAPPSVPGASGGVQFIPSSATYTGPSVAALSGGGAGGGSLASGLAGAAKGAGSFIKDNPMAAAMGLQAGGQYAQSRQEGAQNEWERKRIEDADERERQRQKELEPLWELFKKRAMDRYSSPSQGIGRNPYYS